MSGNDRRGPKFHLDLPPECKPWIDGLVKAGIAHPVTVPLFEMGDVKPLALQGPSCAAIYHRFRYSESKKMTDLEGPVKHTREKAEQELVTAMKGILGSGVTWKALGSPSTLTYEDIVDNRHLYERLGAAFALVGALQKYNDMPRGVELVEPGEETNGQ